MAKFLVLHGPNLNLLGSRQPEHYGRVSLKEINDNLTRLIEADYHELACKQSNAENHLVDWIQQAANQNVDFIIINPAAFTHTSVAMRDALSAAGIPFIEVHLSNVYAREPFRSTSYFSDIAEGVIAGLGAHGYEFAYIAAVDYLRREREYPCPIPGCAKIFHGSRGGWDAHIASLCKHPNWHPSVQDDEKRKRLFKREYGYWFEDER